MTQQPAYTPEEVIAAGLRLRAGGIEPDRCSLYNELGRRGLADTAWKAWTKYRDQAVPANLDMAPADEERSKEMSAAIQSHSRSLATVIECVRTEARAPLLRQVEALDKALSAALADRDELQGLVEILQQEMASLSQKLGRLKEAPDSPRLILPGRY